MRIDLPNFSAVVPDYGGGFANVFKYMDQNLKAAIKVLMIYTTDDLRKVTYVSNRADTNSFLHVCTDLTS